MFNLAIDADYADAMSFVFAREMSASAAQSDRGGQPVS